MHGSFDDLVWLKCIAFYQPTLWDVGNNLDNLSTLNVNGNVLTSLESIVETKEDIAHYVYN